MSISDVLPEIQVGIRRVSLCCHVASLRKRHLEHEAAAVVCDSAHDVQTSWCAANPDVVLH